MKHPGSLIVPVFIPHFGCEHRCVFCDQADITGREAPPSPAEVSEYLSAHLGPETSHGVIAFYGGSFTCLPLSVQENYLTIAARFIDAGHAAYIRLSTRPDCVDEMGAGFLYSHGVRVVELGAQSMDDTVLRASARGHVASDTVKAAGLVKAAGIRLGIQVMAGLPSDSREGFMRTVERVIGLRPEFVRIYPALVVRGAPLEMLYSRGEYTPLELAEAVVWCADACAGFEGAGINVVRTGLQPSESLEASLIAGPYHPAFGHLVRSELALRRMKALIEGERGQRLVNKIELVVNPSELSEYIGMNRSNIDALVREYGPGITIRPDTAVKKGGLTMAVIR